MAYSPPLVSTPSFRKPTSKTWAGSYMFPISGGGHAQINNPTNISFSKTGSYAWAFWIKFDADDDVYRQIITLGSLSTDGYRIVKDRVSGRNVICLQDVDAFTADRWYYPLGFDITKWHHITITWKGNSSSSVSTSCYINGRQMTTKSSSITWASAVATSTPLIFGYDWADHTIGGNINDIVYFDRQIYPSEIFDLMNKRSFTVPVGYWPCDSDQGLNIIDSIEQNNLTAYSGTIFQSTNQSYTGTRQAAASRQEATNRTSV